MIDIKTVLEEMRDPITCSVNREGRWAEAIEVAMREKNFRPLVPPTAGARKVFQTLLKNTPKADMRAVPNQWLLNERALTSKVAEELETEIQRLREALEIIERWEDFPETGRTWEDGTPMSYGAAFGSNGKRDYMRGIARAALDRKEDK